MTAPQEKLPARFWSKVRKTDQCWFWTASKIGNRGYGKYWHDGKLKLAHVVSFEAHHGPVPTGLVVDHICNVRECVNPNHLQAITQRDNARRGAGFSGLNSRKTHCAKGHELTDENVKIVKRVDGIRRKCRECDRQEKRNARRREKYAQ